MPLESLPWGRKEFFNERKHDRSNSVASVTRWRDSASSMYHHRSREIDRCGSADGRPGNGKQGGWQEDFDHGYEEGKYVRSNRENRGSIYNQKDWKSHSCVINSGSPNYCLARPLEVFNDRRPDDVKIMCNSHPSNIGFVNGWNQDQFKEQQNNKMAAVNECGSNQRHVRENSLGSINKWNRLSSMSSRASGYCNSICSKSTGLDSTETKAELHPRYASPSKTPSGDAVACETSVALCDETSSRKKPRLGWGEGLAKFEKKKVEGPDEDSNRNGITSSKVTDFSDCTSPTSPSSVACSLSPGMDTRHDAIGSNINNYTSNSTGTLNSQFLNHLKGLFLSLKDLDADTIHSAGSSLNEIQILQSNDQIVFDDNFIRSNAFKKLLVLKDEISKTLEITESEIDLLETELPTLKSELRNDCSPALPNSVPETFGSSIVNVEGEAKAKIERIDSPGLVSSNFVEPFSSASSELIECPISDTWNGSLCSKNNDKSLYELIYAENKDSAYKASEILNRLLPLSKGQNNNLDIVAANVSSSQVDLFVRKEFAKRKRYLRFKERVLALKFRAFQYLWKEDVRLLSIRKKRAKYQKRFEYSSRFSHGGLQKCRSVIPSRLCSNRNLTLVPTTNIINFTSKLLSDSQVKLCRTLKMQSLILDKKEKSASMFISSIGLIEDPLAVEKERAMINPWTSQEKTVFMDNLNSFGKDFRKIASFLEHKTTADCIEFYYKNHKSDSFEKTKKPEMKKEHTFMLTSGQKRNREMNSASSDLLGTTSVTANKANVISVENKKKGFKRLLLGRPSQHNTPEDNNSISEKSIKRETEAADVLAGICGSLSSEAMSSCITSSMDPGECYQDWKYIKVGSTYNRSFKSEVEQNDEDFSYSDESSGELEHSDWTDSEKTIFLHALSSYGKDFKKISRCVRTRSRDQCMIFFSKARKCLGLDLVLCGSGNTRSCGDRADDANRGGGSDTDDSCTVHMGPVIISNNNLVSKMDEDMKSSVLNGDDDEPKEPNGIIRENNLIIFEAVENLVIDECQTEDGAEPYAVDQDSNNFDNAVVQEDIVLSTGTKVEVKDGPDPHPVYQDSSNFDTSVVREDAVLSTGTEVKTEDVTKHEKPIDHCTTQSNTAIQTQNLVKESVSCDQTEIEKEETSLLKLCKQEPLVVSNFNDNALLAKNFPGESDSNPNPTSVSNKNYISTKDFISDDSAFLQNDKKINDVASLGIGLENRNPITVNDLYQHLAGHPISNHVESSSQILKGYALEIPNKNKVNEGIFSSNLKRKNKGQGFYLQNCNRRKSHSSHGRLPQIMEPKKKYHRRGNSQSSSDSERQCKNSDFKLFGQVVGQPSKFHGYEGNSFNLKFGNHRNNGDEGFTFSKFGQNNYSGLENFSRSCGFWEGQTRKTGFSALPESANFLGKYPPPPTTTTCFRNYQPSWNLEHHRSQAMGNFSVYHPTMESSVNNGVGDYQVYMSQTGNKSQLWMQHGQDTMLQRMNGYDGVSNFQHGYIGEARPAVSDPVAAIRMHYAREEQYAAGQMGNFTVEDHHHHQSWKGKGR